MSSVTLPRAFVWRRLHSLMGLWLVLFLMEHLLVNSQAALLLGDNGQGFVEMVNSIHNLPYLPVIEFTLLGVPILIHLVWGIKILFTAKSNAIRSDGSRPSLPEYGRNRAYSWQRITSWILAFGLIAHVAKFRFIDYPLSLNEGTHSSYFVRLDLDNGLYTVASRLGATLYDSTAVSKEEQRLKERTSEAALIEAAQSYFGESTKKTAGYDSQRAIILDAAQKFEQKQAFVERLRHLPLKNSQIIAVTPDFGTASLLAVRDTFKSPIYVTLYTIFVLSACFHAFNGLWTFLITWGVILRMTAQKRMVSVCIGIMLVIAFLGLASIWGTYFLNLKT
jgi:succinate dehydrogenase / fumarate reductase, cytochrome b subunit